MTMEAERPRRPREDHHISNRGMETVDKARGTLHALYMMVGQFDSMNDVSGNGLAWLLHFVIQGIEDGIDEQRQEIGRAEKIAEKHLLQLEQMAARMKEPASRRRELLRHASIRRGEYPGDMVILKPMMEEAAARDEAQKAFDAQVKRRLRKMEKRP